MTICTCGAELCRMCVFTAFGRQQRRITDCGLVQLLVAEIISLIYGLVMVIVLVGIMLQIAEDGWLAPSSLLFFIVAIQFIVAGVLHPQELMCLPCGVIYYITVPCMYMLLIIFSIFNVHNVTWGTREKKKNIVSVRFFFYKIPIYSKMLSHCVFRGIILAGRF